MPDIPTPLSRRRFVRTAGLGAAGAFLALRSASAESHRASWRRLGGAASGPPARWDHTLASDDDAKALILFGGRDGANTPLGDTWRYDRADGSWTRLDIPGPEPRFGHAVAVDQPARRLYLFGGQSADLFFNDVWVLDLSRDEWARLDPAASATPTPRYGTSAVLSDTGALIVSHGFTFEGRFDDTWAFQPETGEWADLSPPGDAIRPLKRCLHEAVWDDTTKRMLLFGGCSSGFGPCPQGDVWVYDPGSRTWTDVTGASGPTARSNPALVFDRARDQALLFGGLTESGYGADLWRGSHDGDGLRWDTVTVEGEAPGPRASHDAAVAGGALYLFGGITDGGAVLDDLWRLKFGD